MHKFRWLSIDDALAVVAFVALLLGAPFLLALNEQPTLDATAEDMSWYRRHERQSAECRGQQYVAQCCTDARTDLTCIEVHLKGPK